MTDATYCYGMEGEPRKPDFRELAKACDEKLGGSRDLVPPTSWPMEWRMEAIAHGFNLLAPVKWVTAEEMRQQYP